MYVNRRVFRLIFFRVFPDRARGRARPRSAGEESNRARRRATSTIKKTRDFLLLFVVASSPFCRLRKAIEDNDEDDTIKNAGVSV